MPKPALLFILFFFSIGCAQRSNTGKVLITTHFTFYYTEQDDTSMHYISARMEEGYKRITTDLQSGDLPMVNLHFYRNGIELHKAFPGIPEWASGQATSVSEIHMVSPNDPKFDYQNMIRNCVHELAHCASMKINPTIGNNPRWLWESVAIYEGNFPWDPHMLPYMVNQGAPLA